MASGWFPCVPVWRWNESDQVSAPSPPAARTPLLSSSLLAVSGGSLQRRRRVAGEVCILAKLSQDHTVVCVWCECDFSVCLRSMCVCTLPSIRPRCSHPRRPPSGGRRWRGTRLWTWNSLIVGSSSGLGSVQPCAPLPLRHDERLPPRGSFTVRCF